MWHLTLAYLLKGALPQAEAVLSAGIPHEHVPRNLPERQMAWAWGEVALANEEPEEALHAAERLLATVPGERTTQPIPRLLYLKGKALIELKREHEAVQVFEEARRGALERSARPLLWQVHAALGRVYNHLGQNEQAKLAWSAAHTTIRSLAATIDDAYLRDHFLRVALRSLPRESRLLARQAEAETFAGLTERERTVASLIALGHVNREIAEALVVSERTVEAHVSNILSKLGFTSRRQIAAWAIEKGLQKTHHK
jgi:DNA-binding CsgD family transcriptional regulator